MVLFAALFDRAMSDSPLLCTKAVNIFDCYPGLLYHTLRISYTFNDKRASYGQWAELYVS